MRPAPAAVGSIDRGLIFLNARIACRRYCLALAETLRPRANRLPGPGSDRVMSNPEIIRLPVGVSQSVTGLL